MKYYKKTILICINVVKNHSNQSFSIDTLVRKPMNDPRVKSPLATYTIVLPLGTISQRHASQFEKKPQPKIDRQATKFIFQQPPGGLNGRNSYLG